MALLTQTQWEEEKAAQALELSRAQLYIKLRHLDCALSGLAPRPAQGLRGLAVDGIHLDYSPAWVLEMFRKNPDHLSRTYLHSLFHCLLRHLWLRGSRQTALSSLACDITVEHLLDQLQIFPRPMALVRTTLYEEVLDPMPLVAPGPIYRWLTTQTRYPLGQLAREFYGDDHGRWPQDPEDPQSSALAARWENLSRQTQTRMESRAKEQSEGDGVLAAQLSAAKSRRSYKEFLRKFAALREEPHLDPDSFDLNFYTYGLSLYGNMPLVEPLETREQLRVEEFVLVLDTSYSTSGDLIKEFLRQTFALLKSSESFSRRCNLRILQCDDTVRADTLVTDLSGLEKLLSQFTVLGGGGTDFRPAFAYVDRLVEEKAFRHLRGLLYLTDGKGIYPARRPAYDVAFLFLNRFYEDQGLPPWAMKLVLDPEEFLAPAQPREVPDYDPQSDPDYMQEDIQL